MAEDYLHHVEWENNHNAGNERGQAPWKNAPNWKYKKAYPKAYGASASSTTWGIIVLIAMIVVAVFIVFNITTASQTSIVAPIIFIILFGLLFYVTRQ
jgi:hypothetical protein